MLHLSRAPSIKGQSMTSMCSSHCAQGPLANAPLTPPPGLHLSHSLMAVPHPAENTFPFGYHLSLQRPAWSGGAISKSLQRRAHAWQRCQVRQVAWRVKICSQPRLAIESNSVLHSLDTSPSCSRKGVKMQWNLLESRPWSPDIM